MFDVLQSKLTDTSMNVGKILCRRLLDSRSASSSTLGHNFEMVAVHCLRKNRMNIWMCGGPGDRGVDFRGVWCLQSSQVNIIGQCKCYKRKLGAVHLRELEGTLSHELHNTLGVIVTNIG